MEVACIYLIKLYLLRRDWIIKFNWQVWRSFCHWRCFSTWWQRRCRRHRMPCHYWALTSIASCSWLLPLSCLPFSYWTIITGTLTRMKWAIGFVFFIRTNGLPCIEVSFHRRVSCHRYVLYSRRKRPSDGTRIFWYMIGQKFDIFSGVTMMGFINFDTQEGVNKCYLIGNLF